MKKSALVLVCLLISSVASSAQTIVPIVGGVVTADVGRNSTFKVIVNANVTSVVLTSNQTPAAGQVVTLFFTENATGGFSVAFGGNITNACSVTITANATTACQFQFNGTDGTWYGTSGGPTSPSPGSFNSNFDPPLFQNYTLTTAGAQSAINLTANPIDTHTISWRLSPGTITTVTDSFPYSNGSLSGSNANWVNQVGTFNVNNNAAFGSAAAAFITRSDGPPSNTTNAVVQETVVETAGSGTQNHGPCVDMQAAAQTAYCLQAANNLLRIVWWNAGAATILQILDSYAPATGDTIKLVVVRTTTNTFTVYKNGAQIGPPVTDNNITTGGFVGMFSNGVANANGASQFTGGALATCTVALDSSVDGSNWTAGGAIVSQNCSNPNQSSATQSVVANFVRVNVTSLSAGQTLTIVYSGRLSPTAPAGGTGSVSNGQWVNAGEVLWVQDTVKTDLPPAGNFSINAAFRIQQLNGSTYENTWNVNCTLATTSVAHAAGTGFTVPVSGFLTGFNTQVTTGGFPQGYFFTNLYVLTSMPNNSGPTSCTDGQLATANITGGLLLAAMPTGSSYPVAFTGTTLVPTSPWAIPGFTAVPTVANPSAGAEWTYTAPAQGRICIQSVSFQYVTSAAVANRIPVLVLTLNGAKLVYSPTTAQAASLTQVYSFSPGAAAETVTGGATVFHIVPFNNGQLVCFNSSLTTATVGTLTTAKDAADQYSAISIVTQVQQDNN